MQYHKKDGPTRNQSASGLSSCRRFTDDFLFLYLVEHNNEITLTEDLVFNLKYSILQSEQFATFWGVGPRGL